MHIRSNYIPIFIILSATLSACSSFDERNYNNLQATKATTRIGSSIYLLDQCPTQRMGDAAVPLLAPLIGLVADFSVRLIDKALTQYKDGLSGQFLAGSVVDQDVFRREKCIVIVRGTFGSLSSDYISGESSIPSSALKALGLADHPAFYVEMKAGAKAENVVLTPVYVEYSASSARYAGSGFKNVSVVTELSVRQPGKSDNVGKGEKSLVFRHDFGRLAIGKIYTENLLRGAAASQPIVQTETAAIGNITTLVTESEEPSVAMNALVEAFQNKKTDLGAALETTIKDSISGDDKK